ncbi:hypothetical protein, conserved [Eimeria maxima]|uniref:PPPDE domain-containing protein n=1 Tax=Eimeria maxima TaxID=5804 RepID=U6M574_EIMMA|nr:hypothetical protein, conserved [Eimeria maxima]CDJ59171.1 hypothetical protein, conserved [Eimeria maxima]
MPGPDVYLNIYKIDGSPECCAPCGLYHTSVQIGELEYSFGESTGVVCSEHNPRVDGIHSFADGTYQYSLHMGSCNLTVSELYNVIINFRKAFTGSSYNLLNKNCNHFSDALLKAVVGKGIPPHINRASRYGKWLSCLLPASCVYNSEEAAREAAESSSGASFSQIFSGTGNRLGSLQGGSAVQALKRFITMGDCLNQENNVADAHEETAVYSRSNTRQLLAEAAQDRMRRQASFKASSPA